MSSSAELNNCFGKRMPINGAAHKKHSAMRDQAACLHLGSRYFDPRCWRNSEFTCHTELGLGGNNLGISRSGLHINLSFGD